MSNVSSDEIVSKWISGLVKEQTKSLYLRAIKKYVECFDKTPRELIQEGIDDVKREPLDRTNIVNRRIVEFHNYLIKNAEKKGLNGKGKPLKIIGKGFAPTSALTYVNSVKAFYTFYQIITNVKIRGGQPEHPREILTQEQVKRLYDCALTPRDKCLVIFFYSTGCDVSTVVSLKYKQIAKGLETNEEPLKIDIVRPKSGTKYFTFCSEECIYAIRNYLTELKSHGVELEPEDYLFIQRAYKDKSKVGMTANNVMRIFKELGTKTGMLKDKQFNILGTHSFRESFSSVLRNKGRVDSNQVLFLTGHAMGTLSNAYLRQDEETLREVYKNAEHWLSIGLLAKPTVVDAKEIEQLKNQVKEMAEMIQMQNEAITILQSGKPVKKGKK